MGRYIDWSDIVARYPDAAKIAGADTVSSAWLPGIEAELDARLGRRFTVPFNPAPPLVRDLCTDLAYSRITARQDQSKIIYDRVLGLIAEINSGTLPLLSGSGTEMPTNGSATGEVLASCTNSYRTAFGVGDPIDWSRSASQLADEASGRLND